MPWPSNSTAETSLLYNPLSVFVLCCGPRIDGIGSYDSYTREISVNSLGFTALRVRLSLLSLLSLETIWDHLMKICVSYGSQSQTCSKSSRSLTTCYDVYEHQPAGRYRDHVKYDERCEHKIQMLILFTRFHTFSQVFTHEMYEMAGWPTKGSPMCLNAETTHDLALRGASDLLTAEASTHNGLWSGESSLSGWTKYRWKYPLVMTNIAIENDHS